MSTNEFYRIFFRGNKQNEFGHFSMTLILCFVLTDISKLIFVDGLLNHIVSTATAWVLMFVLELMPFNAFSLRDIEYNTHACIFYIVYAMLISMLLF